MARALMLVAANANDPDRLEAFNAGYAQHVQALLPLEGIVSATRWEASPHTLRPGLDALDGRRFLALYEIECDDLERMRDRLRKTSADRTHSDTLELSPPPIALLFEPLGAWKA